MSSEYVPEPPAERQFGLMLSVVCVGLSAYGWYAQWRADLALALLLAGLTILPIAIWLPDVLKPFNKAWFRFGQLLGKVVSPIVLGCIFFGILTPLAFVLRVFGRDELRLQRSPIESYWIERESTDQPSDSFKNQF